MGSYAELTEKYLELTLDYPLIKDDSAAEKHLGTMNKLFDSIEKKPLIDSDDIAALIQLLMMEQAEMDHETQYWLLDKALRFLTGNDSSGCGMEESEQVWMEVEEFRKDHIEKHGHGKPNKAHNTRRHRS